MPFASVGFGGRTHRGHIGGSNHYGESVPVTVYVDPVDPSRSTVPGEPPQSGPAYWTTIVALAGGPDRRYISWGRRRAVVQSYRLPNVQLSMNSDDFSSAPAATYVLTAATLSSRVSTHIPWQPLVLARSERARTRAVPIPRR